MKNELLKKQMLRISKYIFSDIARNKIVLAYTFFLFAVTFGLFQIEEDASKAVLSLLSIVLIVVPLISLIFSTIHYYNSLEFVELMVSQPVSRVVIITSQYTGTTLSLLMGFVVGTGVPLLIYQFDATALSLLFAGTILTIIFSSIGYLVSVKSKDKARGIGVALLVWFYFSLIYDGLVLLLLFTFSDYPVEKFTLLLSSVNPVDLARIFVMLRLDVSALMGYTGATYKDFFGSSTGTLFSGGILMLWAVIPLWLAIRAFRKKDL
jgi:Cu-processing system permease protein